MKNLDIDSENTNTSIDASQRIKIEFTGGSPSEMVQSRATVYTVIVPYSCFSKRLQAIHRSGGKITNISAPRFQLDLPKVDFAVELGEDTTPTLEEVSVVEIEHNPLGVIPDITVESETQDTFGIISEAMPEIKLEDVAEPILEIIPQDILEEIPANISEVAISTPKHEKAIAETAAKSKKSKTSTKASHGFSKHESGTQEKEPVAIAEPVVEIIPEPVVETIPEPVSELITEISTDQDTKNTTQTSSEHVAENNLENELKALVVNDIEEAVPVSKVEPKIESSTPSVKSKKPKASSKSGSGFNKPKSDA